MKATKIGAIAVSAAMVLSVGALAGCTSNAASSSSSAASSSASSSSAAVQPATDEDAVRAAVEKTLDGYKDATPEVVASLHDEVAALGGNIEELGISTDDFIKAFLDEYDYTIENIEVDGNSATATVDLTMKSLADYTEKATEVTTDFLTRAQENPSEFEAMGEAGMKEALGQSMKDMLETLDTEDVPGVELEFDKGATSWEPTVETDELLQALIFTA